MYMPELKPTYKERLRSLTGGIYIEPNHVGAIFRDSQFSHFIESGWHPPLSRWDHKLAAQIPVKLYNEDLKIEALSGDGWPHTLAASIAFIFNPMKAIRTRQAEAANLTLNGTNGRLIRDKVLREAKYAARKAIGSYNAEQLLSGHIRRAVERDIRHHLQAILTDLGVNIDPTSGVFIEALTPPETVTRVQNTHYERRKTIELLENHPETAIQTFLLESLIQQNGVMVFNNRNPMHILLENLYANAFDDSESHPLPADAYQIVNATFTNKAVRANGSHKKEVIS